MQGMKPEKKRVVERGRIELAVFDALFQREDVARQVRRELGVAQDAKACFDVTGGVSRRASSARSAVSSTGSPSKAMLSATFSGIRLRRMRLCSAAGRARQRAIACFQSMNGIIGLYRRAFNPFFRRRRSAVAPQEFRDPAQHVVCRVLGYRVQ
jgi:hypothetical protein